MSKDWYPGTYASPTWTTDPVINFWSEEDFRRRKRKYWDAAWTRAILRWGIVGIRMEYHGSFVKPPAPNTVTCDVVDVPPGIGAWCAYYPYPTAPVGGAMIEVDITTWRNALAARNIKYLTEVMTHEIGHILGFGHGGMGIMSYDPNKDVWPNAEEIAAARAYWL